MSDTTRVSTVQRPNDLDWLERVEGPRARFVLTPSRMGAVPILVFAAIWDSFLVTLVMAMVRSPRTPPLAFLFPLLHAAVGVFVTWLALVRCLNRWQVTIDREQFVLEGTPIPARGARAATASIDRFDVLSAKGLRGGPSWRLRVLTGQGGSVRTPLPLRSGEDAAFIAARLNEALSAARS